MRLRIVAMVMVGLVCLAAPMWAGDAKTKFKTAEPKHFNRSEGVEVSPEFSDLLYAELKQELKKAKLFQDIVGEGEVVDAADAPNSVSIDGNLLEYKKGSVVKAALIGFGSGLRSLRAQITVKRMSDQQALYDKELKVKADPRWNEKVLAKFLANKIAKELKSNLH